MLYSLHSLSIRLHPGDDSPADVSEDGHPGRTMRTQIRTDHTWSTRFQIKLERSARFICWTGSGGGRENKIQATVGFEPTNYGFAIRSLSPLGHVAICLGGVIILGSFPRSRPQKVLRCVLWRRGDTARNGACVVAVDVVNSFCDQLLRALLRSRVRRSRPRARLERALGGTHQPKRISRRRGTANPANSSST